MATSDEDVTPAELARAQLWRGVVTVAAVAFSLRTAWDLRAIGPDYERVVARSGAPPVYTLVILAASLVTLFNAYVAAAALWFRRRWAPAAIVGYGLVLTATRIGVRMYFAHGEGALFSGDEWAVIVSMCILLGVVAAVVDRAFIAMPSNPAPPELPRLPRWEFWLDIAAAVPPTLFAVRMLVLGGVGNSDGDGNGGNLARLAWISLPLVLLMLKQSVDAAFSLRPEGPTVAKDAASRPSGAFITLISPEALADTISAECATRVLRAPDSILKILRTRGIAPSVPPPMYSIELLLFGIFIHDNALIERNGPLVDHARRSLRNSTRALAEGLLADAGNLPMTPEAWGQFVDRRFAEYGADARQAELNAPSKDRHLIKLCASVMRHASKSHVPNAPAAKILVDFIAPETARARAALGQYELELDHRPSQGRLRRAEG